MNTLLGRDCPHFTDEQMGGSEGEKVDNHKALAPSQGVSDAKLYALPAHILPPLLPGIGP